MQAHTVFGSLRDYTKGTIELVSGEARHYVFSNIFEVASKSKPYDKIAVGKNLEYVIEAVRAEGTSDWFAASHDEFVVVMDGEVTVTLVELANHSAIVAAGKEGTVKLSGAPQGSRMGTIRLKRGHQALLPKGAAYQFSSAKPSVMLWQTLLGDLTVQKWREICLH